MATNSKISRNSGLQFYVVTKPISLCTVVLKPAITLLKHPTQNRLITTFLHSIHLSILQFHTTKTIETFSQTTYSKRFIFSSFRPFGDISSFVLGGVEEEGIVAKVI